MDVTPQGLKVVELAPGVTFEALQARTGVKAPAFCIGTFHKALMQSAWGLWQLHRVADFARRDLARAQGFSSLGTHSSTVSRGLVSHHTRTSGFDGAGLGHSSGFGSHFSAGAVGFELGGELRSI
eukprot:gene10314-10381_t